MVGGQNLIARFIVIVTGAILMFQHGHAEPQTCDIPKGLFEGMFFDNYFDGPLYGFRCQNYSDFHYVRVYRCLTTYCCTPSCNCASGSQSNACPGNATVLSCFATRMEPEQFRYKCCDGSYVDQFHVCTKQVTCGTNNGGCDSGQLCLHNDTSGLDYCDCPTGFNMTLLDVNGTKDCIDIDECKLNTSHCSDTCINTKGSYRCACRENMTLSEDGHTCVAIVFTEYESFSGSAYTTTTNGIASFDFRAATVALGVLLGISFLVIAGLSIALLTKTRSSHGVQSPAGLPDKIGGPSVTYEELGSRAENGVSNYVQLTSIANDTSRS